jgi:peptidoglycan hydrolase-like protein with peptidoglycan-binding domain
MIKKYILGALVALSLPALVYAATPVLTVSGNGDNNNVTVTVTGGEPNANVVLFYNPSVSGTVQQTTLGRTDMNGYWSGVVSSGNFNIGWNTPVYVQVGGYQSLPATWTQSGTAMGSTGNLGFSLSSPSFGVGQNGMVTLSGGNGTYYVSSNSNPNGVSASVSGNTLTLYGSQSGNSVVTICATSGECGTVNATVNSSNSSTGMNMSAPTLSQSSLAIGTNGQGAITLSGGTGPYTVTVPSGSGLSTTLVGNTLYVNGSTSGQGNIQVCSANTTTSSGACTLLPVTVSSGTATSGTTNTGTTGGLSFAIPVNLGSPVQLMLAGGSGSYYVQSASTPAVATVSGNTLTLNGSNTGNASVTVCSTTGSSCLPITLSILPALSGTGGGYFFDNDLSVGMSGQDVSELQSRLATEGYFQAAVTGYFGPITMAAVQSYQRTHGISATGYVGPITRAMLNQ